MARSPEQEKKRDFRAQRVLDLLMLRPAIMKNGDTVTLDHYGLGGYWISKNGEPMHMAVWEILDIMFDEIDWFKSDEAVPQSWDRKTGEVKGGAYPKS